MADFSFLFKLIKKKSTISTKGSFRLLKVNIEILGLFFRTFIKDLYGIVNFQTFSLLTKTLSSFGRDVTTTLGYPGISADTLERPEY